jgi:acyl-CoA synthetase (AMP-forming)/AMP-acid ligase II
MRMADYFDAAAQRFPDNEAFVDSERRLSYAEAQRFVHAAAHAIARDPDLPVGTHIGVYSPNLATVSLLQLAINRADRAWVLVHTRNTPETNAHILAFADTRLVFYHSAFEAQVAAMRPALGASIKFVCMDRAGGLGPALDQWLAGNHGPFPVCHEDPHATSFVSPTGGTTGPHKTAVHTHRSIEIAAIGVNETMASGPDARQLIVAPLTHAAGFFVLSFLARGATNVILPGFDIELVLRTIEQERITHTYFPPTAIYALLAHPAVRKADLSSLRCIVVGGAPVVPTKFKEAVSVFGPILYEMYGQTETLAPITVKRPQDCMKEDGKFDEDVLRSAGRAAPYARVEIMDAEGRFLPPGQMGEIVVMSSMTMRGYYKMPKESEECARGGWHHTTDVGIRDERGFITIVDRLKDMIISGGLNIYPSEIEAAIGELDSVLDCSVIGVPDEKWGESVKAVVQLRPGRTVSEESVMEHCRGRLGGLKTPRSVEFWPDLPRSPVGKVLKREIREKFWKGQWRAV